MARIGRLVRSKDMIAGKNRVRLHRGAAILLAAWSIAHVASATTLERKSLSDLARASELIVDATVVDQAVHPLANGQGARTCFTFKIAEVISGSHPGKTLHLCFFGGQVNGRGFAVSGMRYPDVGEHGIYLIESTHEAMLNPLIGWDQGRFLVVTDPATGASRLTTADGQRIVGLSPEAAKPTSDTGEMTSPSGATASGVLSDGKPGIAGAISRDDFVAKLRSYRVQ